MILSNEEIRKALRSGEIVVWPEPAEDQYTTSAVDSFLGDEFRRWDLKLFKAKGGPTSRRRRLSGWCGSTPTLWNALSL